jgi:hypothetical protein
MNPAIKPANRFYLGIPVLSGFSVGFGNDFLELSDIFIPNLKADSIIAFQNPDFDLQRLASKLKDKNTVMTDAQIQLIGIGFPIGKNISASVEITDRLNMKMVFPKEMMNLFINGPDALVGNTLSLAGLNIRSQLYREYAFGIQGSVMKDLRIGGRIKYLSGITSFALDNRNFSLKVNNDLSQTVTADATLGVSGKETLNRIFVANGIGGSASTDIKGFFLDYIRNPGKNSGFAADLGAVYNLGNLFTFSASVTDLGYINWKDDLKSYDANNSFNLPGITFADVVNQTFSIDDMIGHLVDTIKANFVENTNPVAFKTMLPTAINAGASFNVGKIFSAGVLSTTRIFAGQAKQSVTLSANAYLGSIFSASASYSIANYSYDNLGFGLAFKAGFAQIYLLADKIPVQWDKIYFKKSGNDYFGVPMPSHLNMINIQMGMNICFGKPVTKKTDKPMVIVDQNLKGK